MGGFRSQLEASYVFSHNEKLWYNSLSVDDYIYLLYNMIVSVTLGFMYFAFVENIYIYIYIYVCVCVYAYVYTHRRTHTQSIFFRILFVYSIFMAYEPL